MTKIYKSALFLIVAVTSFIIFTNSVNAAPFPATSTSVLTNPETAPLLWSDSIDLSRSLGTWSFQKFEKGIGKSQSLESTLKQGSEKARLQVFNRELNRNETLDSQLKKWSKEFSQYGFEILATKEIKNASFESYTFDLYHRDKQMQLRQVLIPNQNNNITIVTCLDERSTFTRTFNECQDFVRNLNHH